METKTQFRLFKRVVAHSLQKEAWQPPAHPGSRDLLARCFTFRDIQMAPTLKEYKRPLGLPLAGSAHHFHQGQLPSWVTVAKLLRIFESEMGKERRN
ncbi:hypothetical protein CR513_52416, partial [Mucuna pruriens]